MTTLRVYLDLPPEANTDAEWVLYDSEGGVVRSGRDRPAGWPDADALEAVVAARHGRVATLTLPPLPPARLLPAARFALEDQLAGGTDDSHLAVGTQNAAGAVRVAVVADAWMRALAAASERLGIGWSRMVLESDLAQAPPAGWCWCAAALAQPGFVRTSEGATIAVGAAPGEGPPDELRLALAGNRGQRPRAVRIDIGGATPALAAHCRTATGVDFVPGSPWRWSAASPAAFAAAIDLRLAPAGTAAKGIGGSLARALRPALWVGAATLAIHLLATTGSWVWLQWQAWQVERDLTALARAVAPDDTSGVAPATVIARRDAAARHRAGLVAPDDLLPILARAAPALAALPPGAIRSLRYANDHVVLDLQKLDPAQPARLQQELQRQGLVAVAAPTASGSRVRVGRD
jgi:general secretion pathway protein L